MSNKLNYDLIFYANVTKDNTLEDAMPKVNIDSVKSGATLSSTIFRRDGSVLLMKGTELTEVHLNLLRQHGISQVYLQDDILSETETEGAVGKQVRNEAVNLVRRTMKNFCFSAAPDSDEVKVVVNEILDGLLKDEYILHNLSDIKSVDDYTFEHSLNVCILSLIMGIGLGFDRDSLAKLGVGALLHDIGKLFIPKEILKKPYKLTEDEFEQIKKHTILGFDMLKKNNRIDIISAYIALGHHERYDGSGYPFQLKGEDIQLYSRIVAVADVYDALTSDRIYRKKLNPNDVHKYFATHGIRLFDSEVVESLIKYADVFLKGLECC